MSQISKSLLRVAIAGLAISALFAGCQHNTKKATPAATTGSNLSPIDDGRAIYTSTCTRCHAAKTISNYTLADWTNVILPDMASRAGLSSAQESDVLAYVQSVLGNTP